MIDRSWFALDAKLKPIDYQGDSHFRFTEDLAKEVIEKYSKSGDWVLDPFVGFGTTVHVAQELNRNAIGFDVHKERAEFAAKNVQSPNRIVNDRVENIDKYELPKFDLVFTSPPYTTVRLEDDPQGATYFEDMKGIFLKIKNHLNPTATVVVEVANIKDQHGVRPLAWQLGELLSTIYDFQGEIIHCSKASKSGPDSYFDHSYLLVYKA
jgi:16S rRNA G966 N2-methylase RsmD